LRDLGLRLLAPLSIPFPLYGKLSYEKSCGGGVTMAKATGKGTGQHNSLDCFSDGFAGCPVTGVVFSLMSQSNKENASLAALDGTKLEPARDFND